MELNRDQGLEIIKHFKSKPVGGTALEEFCKRKSFQVITAEQYEDYLFAYNHDARVEKVLPDLLKILCRLQNVPEFASHKERQAIMDANAALEVEICQLLEDHEILYQEIELILGGLGSRIQGAIEGAKRRVNNMAANELLKVAEAKFGSPLTLKALGEHNRKK